MVARGRRELLLRVHRHRLRREDLEDCYSQATLELIAHVRKGGRLAGRAHAANVLEQRFLSRVLDRRRALSGRSPLQSALEVAMPLEGEHGPLEIADRRSDVEQLVMLRSQLRSLCEAGPGLSSDQRLVLVSQVGGELGCAEFCRRFGWSSEKYRKVAQRGRARLRGMLAAGQVGVPPFGAGSEEAAGTCS